MKLHPSMAPQPKPNPPIRGILKKPKASPAFAPSAVSKSDPSQVAFHHARILQDRKDVEAKTLDNIVELLDLPRHASHPPHNPHPSDVTSFTSLVRILQPTDYDDLITERNLYNKCGYVLCSNKRRRYTTAGTYKLINKGRKNFDIVETAELEKWCSQECTRRALWIKVQLNETAAWERVGLPDLRIELLPGVDSRQDTASISGEEGSRGREPESLAAELATLQPGQGHSKAARDAINLALDRGEHAKTTATHKVDIVIRERKVGTSMDAPVLGDACNSRSIEGYNTKFGTKSAEVSSGNKGLLDRA